MINLIILAMYIVAFNIVDKYGTHRRRQPEEEGGLACKMSKLSSNRLQDYREAVFSLHLLHYSFSRHSHGKTDITLVSAESGKAESSISNYRIITLLLD